MTTQEFQPQSTLRSNAPRPVTKRRGWTLFSMNPTPLTSWKVSVPFPGSAAHRSATLSPLPKLFQPVTRYSHRFSNLNDLQVRQAKDWLLVEDANFLPKPLWKLLRKLQWKFQSPRGLSQNILLPPACLCAIPILPKAVYSWKWNVTADSRNTNGEKAIPKTSTMREPCDCRTLVCKLLLLDYGAGKNLTPSTVSGWK